MKFCIYEDQLLIIKYNQYEKRTPNNDLGISY